MPDNRLEPYAAAPMLESICNEIAQPLTVMTSLVELWEDGLDEPTDLELMKTQVLRLGAVLQILRGFSGSSYSEPCPNFELALPMLEAANMSLNSPFCNAPAS